MTDSERHLLPNQQLRFADIRDRIDRVLARWYRYRSFAQLFDALLRSCRIGAVVFAQRYDAATGRHISPATVSLIRLGEIPPSYQFISDIVDHRLLHMLPEPTKTANDANSGGDKRVALFAAAGLIEVTPESVRDWNEEILAGWQRSRALHPAGTHLAWHDLMGKLLGFHTQGGRWGDDSIAEAADRTGSLRRRWMPRRRVHRLLTGCCRPARDERIALAKLAGLNEEQIDLIEAAVENRTLLLA